MHYLKNIGDSDNVFIKIGFFLFLVFALTRPLTLVDARVPFIIEVYSLISFYLFTFFLFLCIQKSKFERTDFIILSFCSFCLISFAWGTEFEDFIKLISPFVFFFSAKIFLNNKNKIEKFLVCYKLGFFFPLLISTLFIILGLRIQMVEFWSEVPRHSGVYSGSHALAYQMLFYSYFFSFYLIITKNKNTKIKIISGVMFALSVYCLYQSHTRTAFIGFFLFWTIFLWRYNRKKFFYFSIFIIIFGIVFSSQLINIFLKKTDEPDIDRATSGRIELWENYFQSFYEFTIPEKLLGKGLGWKRPGPGFHNDFLKLLLNVGIIGFILYLFILISILYDIFFCSNPFLKYFFLSIISSVVIMNSASNVVISRLELGQIFWLFMGFFYRLKDAEDR